MVHANVYTERPDIPGIKKLVKRMQDFALKHPYVPEDAFKGIYVNEGCKSEFTYDGIELVLVLSANKHSESDLFWSLSVCRKDNQPMEDKWVESLVIHFFLDTDISGPVMVNPPNPVVPNLKQYSQKIFKLSGPKNWKKDAGTS